MKIDKLKKSCKIRLLVAVVLLIPIISAFLATNSWAKTAKEIDASVDVAIKRFYKQVDGAAEFVKASKGMLVMPNVVKGAFIIGGEYGEGALRIGGKTVDYYNTASGSIGLQIGGIKINSPSPLIRLNKGVWLNHDASGTICFKNTPNSLARTTQSSFRSATPSSALRR